MDEHDAASQPTEPASLKELSHNLFFDTLEPDQRIKFTARSLGEISEEDLTRIPLATIERCVAAHAAAPITQTLLERLPELKGRMRATNHFHEIVTRPMAYQWTQTTYLIGTADGDLKTLVVESVHSTLHTLSQSRTDIELYFTYTAMGTGVTSASFKFSALDDNRSCDCPTTLRSSSLQKLLLALADDLQLPTKSSPESEAFERAQAALQEERRSRLRLDAEATKVAHGWHGGASRKSSCRSSCEDCGYLLDDLDKDLDLLGRSSTKYPLAELETPDAKGRDVTFGRLIRALVPYDFRIERIYAHYWRLEFMESGRDGEGEYTLEDLLVGFAVAGVDLDRAADAGSSGWE